MTTNEPMRKYHCGMCEHVWETRIRPNMCADCDSDEIEAFADLTSDQLQELWHRSLLKYPWVAHAADQELKKRN